MNLEKQEKENNNLYKNFDFQINTNVDFCNGRLGLLKTPHGSFQTPAFIFCATKASIKNLTARDFKEEGTQIILANTYHLMLNGGADMLSKQGGLASVMGWNGPTLTDSGGFQVFSFGHGLIANEIKGNRDLSKRPSMISKIKKDGVVFRSYINGSSQLLTPERSIETQRKIGADLILVFDECTPFNVPKEYTEKSMFLSHSWEERSFEYFSKHNDQTQALYGIVQGGVYEDLRQKSVDFVGSLDFFGTAVGGCLGKDKQQMYQITEYTMRLHRENQKASKRPVHLLGIGSIADIFFGVEQGIDTFDCVHPTRIARHGCAIVSFERFNQFETMNNDKKKAKEEKKNKEFISLKNSFFKDYFGPIDETCSCHTCKNYSCSYLNYLIKANENSFMSMISIHNIHQMNKLMSEIRQTLSSGLQSKWGELKKKWIG
jgi:queuine tRNA-ribosyltransferase